VFDELGEIAFVIAQRVSADVAFVTQMIEELSEQLVEHGARLPCFRSLKMPDFFRPGF